MEKACKNCRLIIAENICPDCKTTSVSDDWIGEVIILDSTRSQISRNTDIKKPGRYALRVR